MKLPLIYGDADGNSIPFKIVWDEDSMNPLFVIVPLTAIDWMFIPLVGFQLKKIMA